MKTIYIIDDDNLYQLLLKRSIEKLNPATKIVPFKNGSEAWVHIEERLATGQAMPDLLLLDINMPVMDGWQFLEVLEQKKEQFDPMLCIYMISSSIDHNDRRAATSNPLIRQYISKPVPVDVLAKIIHE
jgi:CheY-like chemotaxis protein